MKYIFPNYLKGKRILRIGPDTLEVSDGIAEIDVLDPAQVTLAEVYGGKPARKPAPSSSMVRRPIGVAASASGSQRLPAAPVDDRIFAGLSAVKLGHE